MGIGRRGQGEGDDNNVAGNVSKEEIAHNKRESNRRDKLNITSLKATNRDGNQKKR